MAENKITHLESNIIDEKIKIEDPKKAETSINIPPSIKKVNMVSSHVYLTGEWKRLLYGQSELKHALTLKKSATGNDQAKRRWNIIGARAMCA